MIFQAVLRPTVSLELVAWHEESMGAVNGIFGSNQACPMCTFVMFVLCREGVSHGPGQRPV